MTGNWRGTAAVFALVAGILAVAFGPMSYQEYRSNRLLKHGARADARVVSIRETGNLHNYQPEVRIELEVQPPEKPSFKATVTTFMSPVYLPRMQPGATVPVRYDESSREKVALVPPRR